MLPFKNYTAFNPPLPRTALKQKLSANTARSFESQPKLLCLNSGTLKQETTMTQRVYWIWQMVSSQRSTLIAKCGSNQAKKLKLFCKDLSTVWKYAYHTTRNTEQTRKFIKEKAPLLCGRVCCSYESRGTQAGFCQLYFS